MSVPSPAAVNASTASDGNTQRLAAAPLVRRMAAFLYEGVLVFGIVFATGLVYSISMHQTNAMQHRSGLIATCFVVLGLYFTLLWVRAGQTLAMKTWHLRLVTETGAPLSPRRAVARYLAAWIWFVPPLALAQYIGNPSVALDLGLPAAWVVLYALSTLLQPRRQFWHDVLCGTAIVNARPAAPLPQ